MKRSLFWTLFSVVLLLVTPSCTRMGAPKDPAVGLDMPRIPRPDATLELTVTVLDQNDQPIKDLEVSIVDTDWGTFAQVQDFTNEKGVATLSWYVYEQIAPVYVLVRDIDGNKNGYFSEYRTTIIVRNKDFVRGKAYKKLLVHLKSRF